MYIGNHNYNLNDRLLGSCMESLNRSYWMRPYFRRLVSASKLSHYNHLVVAGGGGKTEKSFTHGMFLVVSCLHVE